MNIKCPICREFTAYYTDSTEQVEELCNACKFMIKWCIDRIGHDCTTCINKTITADLSSNIKVRKNYGCHKGSRLMKYCKKNKISRYKMLDLIGWKFEVEKVKK